MYLPKKFLFYFVCLISIQALANEKPNVVLILIDDLSHYGTSTYGGVQVNSQKGLFSNINIRTPRIDKVAEAGVRCENAFVYPLCESTRIALMSGLTNDRNFLRCKSQHASDITFGDVFNRAGYKTGIFGKWKQTRGTREIPGKDYIYEFGWDEFCCFDVTMEGQRFINPNLVINGEIKNYNHRTDVDPETGRRWYGPDICNRHALKFIDENKDENFFLYYSMLLMHDDHKPTPDTKPNSIFDSFDEANNNKNGHTGDDQRYFPDMLKYMDKLIGKVIDKLEEHNLTENTLLIIMGDNGTKEAFSHTIADGTIYPGRKGGNTDNGIHVPLLIQMPNTIEKRESMIGTYDGLVYVTDVFPTICDAAGIEIFNRNKLDGISFWPQLVGNSREEHRDLIYTWYNANNPYTKEETIIRYAFNKDFKRYAPSKHYPEGRFFDLRTDPLERVGDTVFEIMWGVLRYSGLDLNKLTPEQESTYIKLGQVLKEHEYTKVESLKIEGKVTQSHVGESMQLSCRVLPANATRNGIIWHSDNPHVATIDKFGSVKALSPGKTTIRVYSWDDAYPTSANEDSTFFTTGIQDAIAIEITKK